MPSWHVDAWACSKGMIDRLLAGETDYAALRRDALRQAHAEANREYHVRGSRDHADHKQYRRAARRRKSRAQTR